MYALDQPPILRARVSQTLGSLLLDHSATEVGQGIGHAPSTVLRRGDVLAAWPADELLMLGYASPELALTIRAAVTRTPERIGDAAAATADALALAERLGQEVATLVAAVRTGGRIDASEARTLTAHLCELETESEKLRAHLATIMVGGAR